MPLDIPLLNLINVSVGVSGSDSDITEVAPRWRRFVDMNDDDRATFINPNVELFICFNQSDWGNSISIASFFPRITEEGELVFDGVLGNPNSDEDLYWTALKFTNKPSS